MPNKTGRNDPCHCGSGQKYKRCCLEKDQAAESKVLAAQAAAAAAKEAKFKAELAAARAAFEHGYDETDDLTEASNAAVDLVHAGKLDEAEQAARDLIVRFPEVHDGYDRLGMVHEARGEKKLAADCYRKVVEFVRTHPKQYDPDFADRFDEMIEELDPPTPG
jgi:TolA-binding protein